MHVVGNEELRGRKSCTACLLRLRERSIISKEWWIEIRRNRRTFDKLLSQHMCNEIYTRCHWLNASIGLISATDSKDRAFEKEKFTFALLAAIRREFFDVNDRLMVTRAGLRFITIEAGLKNIKDCYFVGAVWSTFLAALTVSWLFGSFACCESGCIDPVLCNRICQANACNRSCSVCWAKEKRWASRT